MKIQVKNYTFNKTAKTVTFTDYTSIDLDSILLITNVTTNTIIYNFAKIGGTVTNNILTLDYDTSSMSDTDDLQIFYDNPILNPATEESLIQLKRIVKLLESSGIVDLSGRQRISVDNQVSILPASYYAAANQFNIPSSTLAAPMLNAGVTYVQPVQTGPYDPRWKAIEDSRVAYNQGIRSHLSFS